MYTYIYIYIYNVYIYIHINLARVGGGLTGKRWLRNSRGEGEGCANAAGQHGDSGVCEKGTPPEKNALRKIGLQCTESRGRRAVSAAGLPVQGSRKRMFFFTDGGTSRLVCTFIQSS